MPYLDLTRPWLSENLVAWPVLPSVFLAEEKAISVKAFGLPLLLVRSDSGKLSAHIDRCPHRHVSFFTSGKAPTVEGNTFTCPYHLQTFDQSGICIRSIHDKHPPTEHLVNLSTFELHDYIWIPVSAEMFQGKRPTQLQAQELSEVIRSIKMPSEFTYKLNNRNIFDCTELFSYQYANGPWQIAFTSGIDHTHGFKVHQIARTVHNIRGWLGNETLSGMHMICNDEERSVLVTYKQYAEKLEAYWKVGGAPNLWLNKLGEDLYIAVIFVPETHKSTKMYGTIYLGENWRFLLENHPMRCLLKDLSIQNSIEDQPYIESQADYLQEGQLPIGNASTNDSPVYHFFQYFEAMTGGKVNFHNKPKISDMLIQTVNDVDV